MKKTADFSSKPYNRCLACPHRKVRCDGPRTSGLPLERWKEYMRDMKVVNDLTNSDIAEIAELPVKTVERALSPSIMQDVMRDTARRIENAIIGSTSTYPCLLAFEEENRPVDDQRLNDALRDLERALQDKGEYQVMLDKIHDSYKSEIEMIRADAQRQIEFLLKQLSSARADNDNLWAESNRKSKLIDKFIMQRGLLDEED